MRICELCGRRSTEHRPPAVPGIIFYIYPLSSGCDTCAGTHGELLRCARQSKFHEPAIKHLSRRRPRIKNVAFGLSARRAPAENSQTKLIKGQGPASLNKIADQGISRRAGKLQSSVRTKSGKAHTPHTKVSASQFRKYASRAAARLNGAA